MDARLPVIEQSLDDLSVRVEDGQKQLAMLFDMVCRDLTMFNMKLERYDGDFKSAYAEQRSAVADLNCKVDEGLLRRIQNIEEHLKDKEKCWKSAANLSLPQLCAFSHCRNSWAAESLMEFLQIQSLTRAMSVVTSEAPTPKRSCIVAEKVDTAKAKNTLLESLAQLEQIQRQAVVDVFDFLTQGCEGPKQSGGTIAIICDDKFVKSEHFPMANLDEGALRGVFRRFGRSMRKKEHAVKTIWNAFRSHSVCDRWDEATVARLQEELGRDDKVLRKLIDQPMDGAIVCSLNGTVVAAAERLKFLSGSRDICRCDGKGLGTRHQSAFGAAEALATKQCKPAVVIVVSESGSVTLMLVSGNGSSPRILQILASSSVESQASEHVPQMHHKFFAEGNPQESPCNPKRRYSF